MSPERVHLDYLKDILDGLQKAHVFVGDLDRQEFAKDEKTVFAVVRALEIVGEAAKQIPQDVQEEYSRVPWRQMARMRDKLLHHYFGMDLNVIWKTVEEDVPELIAMISEIISNTDASL